MSKRLSLRDFQESLSARLLSAKRGETTAPLLGLRSGGWQWLLDLPDSGEVIPLTQLTAVPLTQPWFAGIANIRGALHSVVDFSMFMGGEPTPRNERSRLLLVGSRHGINSALLVEGTSGLKPLSGLEKVSMPDKAPRGAWIDAAYTDAQGSHWLQIGLSALLADPIFLDIGL